MNIRQLQHFLAVMETGSLSIAATQVHLSESALSRSLKALEDELKVPLFDRSNRRLQPTSYALEYLDRAKRIVFDAREGVRSLAIMQKGDYGPLAFGLGSSIAIDLLPIMLQEMLIQSPELRIKALVQSSDILLEALLKEQLDFFIGDTKMAMNIEGITVEPLYNCSFGWFTRREHPLSLVQNITIAEIKAYPMIGSGYMNHIHSQIMSQLYGLTLPIENHFFANLNNVEATHKLIATTNAILPSTHIAMLQPLRQNHIVQLDVTPRLAFDLTLGIIRLSHRTLVPSAEKAFKSIRDYFNKVKIEIDALGESLPPVNPEHDRTLV